MSDPAHEYTDEEIRRVERRLAREYKQAGAEIQKKMERYLERSAVNNEKKRKQVENGELSEEEYKKWLYGQTMVGQRWKEMRENLAVDYHNANLRAKGITDQSLPRVYAENFNFGTYMCEKQTKISTAFTLYNERAVRKLAADDPKLLPARKTTKSAENKDISWNKKKITSAMMQGILQGEPIDKVAKRLQAVTDMNEHAAVRNARTMMTSVQNSARLDSFIEMQEKTGVPMSKRWLATLDGRTRHSHRIVDGTTVKLTEPFANGLQFPADPDGAPAEVYNCRCRLVMKIDEIDDDLFDLSNRNTDKLDADYETWKHALERRLKSSVDVPALIESMRNKKIWDGLPDEKRDAILEAIENGDPEFVELAEKCMDNCTVDWSGVGEGGTSEYLFGTGRITMYGEKGDAELARTFWHEFGHYMDDAEISGTGIKHVKKYKSGAEYELNGTKAVVENIGYHDAMAKDVTKLLKDSGLDEEFYVKMPEDEYTRPVICKKDTGEVVDWDDWRVRDKLERALNKRFDDICGVTRAKNYMQELGYPEEPNRDDYFEFYETPKRKILRERQKFKGAQEAYDDAMREYWEKREAFESTHDMGKIWAEKERLYEEALAIKEKLGCVSDTLDESTYGMFLSEVVLGGHSPEYYRTHSPATEGVANVFQTMMMNDPEVIAAWEEIAPSLFEVIREGWLHHD